MTSRFRYSLARDGGFTLTEMLVVTMLIGFVMGTGYYVLNAAISMRNGIEARSIATHEAGLATDRLTLELRQAQEIQEGAGAFGVAEGRRCVFYCDVDRDGVLERITYEVTGRTLTRTQAEPLTEVPPFSWGSESSPEIMVSNLKDGWTGDVFTYYQRQYPATVATQNRLISSVEFRVITTASIGDRTSEVDSSTWVKVRAVQNAID